MPYYTTIDEDLTRAKQIIAQGKMPLDEVSHLPEGMRGAFLAQSGTIYGQDIYAAYRLLESFVAEIESARGRATARKAEWAAQEREAARLLAGGWTPITTKAEFDARYGDRDAADKIQRGVLYLDIGYLCGVVENLQSQLEPRNTFGRQHSSLSGEHIADLRGAVTRGAGHDCGEWREHDGRCLLCDRLLEVRP